MAQYYQDPVDDDLIEDNESKRLHPLAVALLLLLILAMVATLAYPLIQQAIFEYSRPPTPTPFFLREA